MLSVSGAPEETCRGSTTSAVGQAAVKELRSRHLDSSPGQGLSQYLVFLVLFRFYSLQFEATAFSLALVGLGSGTV